MVAIGGIADIGRLGRRANQALEQTCLGANGEGWAALSRSSVKLNPRGPLAPFRFQETDGGAAAKVVVFDFGNDDRPHAAWFPHTQAEPARAAAKQLRLNVIDVPNSHAADLVAKLPAGQFRNKPNSLVQMLRSLQRRLLFFLE